MSRPLRIDLKSGFYYVMNRGRSRQRIFRNDDYCTTFLNTLNKACYSFGMEVHAYCLMSNQYQLLLKTHEGNLNRAMCHVNGVYTQRCNRVRQADSALFRGVTKRCWLIAMRICYVCQSTSTATLCKREWLAHWRIIIGRVIRHM